MCANHGLICAYGSLSSKAVNHTKFDEHSNHATVGQCEGTVCIEHSVYFAQTAKLTGAPLTWCTFQAGMRFIFTLNLYVGGGCAQGQCFTMLVFPSCLMSCLL